MSAAEQAATADPEAADRHKFCVVGVYPDGRGIDAKSVSARELHAYQDFVRQCGAQAITHYLGEDTGSGPELIGLDAEQTPAPVAVATAASKARRSTRKGRK